MKAPFQKVVRPTLVEVQQAFELIDQLFTDLLGGEVLVAIVGQIEEVVFRTTQGDYLPALPALDGWISCWERFSLELGFRIHQQPLRDLAARLREFEIDYEHTAPLSKDEVYAATQVIAEQRQQYRQMDVFQIRRISQAEIAAIHAED